MKPACQHCLWFEAIPEHPQQAGFCFADRSDYVPGLNTWVTRVVQPTHRCKDFEAPKKAAVPKGRVS